MLNGQAQAKHSTDLQRTFQTQDRQRTKISTTIDIQSIVHTLSRDYYFMCMYSTRKECHSGSNQC